MPGVGGGHGLEQQAGLLDVADLRVGGDLHAVQIRQVPLRASLGSGPGFDNYIPMVTISPMEEALLGVYFVKYPCDPAGDKGWRTVP